MEQCFRRSKSCTTRRRAALLPQLRDIRLIDLTLNHPLHPALLEPLLYAYRLPSISYQLLRPSSEAATGHSRWTVTSSLLSGRLPLYHRRTPRTRTRLRQPRQGTSPAHPRPHLRPSQSPVMIPILTPALPPPRQPRVSASGTRPTVLEACPHPRSVLVSRPQPFL